MSIFENYEVGQKILLLSPDSNFKPKNAGKTGTVISISSNHVYVRYDDGNEGRSDNPSRYYKIISEANAPACATNNSMLKNIKEFVKNSLLSADEKALREVGFKDSCGNYTQEAKDFSINALCEEKEADMVKVADALIAESKKK